MKRFLAFLILFATLSGVQAAHEGWLTDFDTAKKQAKAESKRIVMLFTGSDWCPNCQSWEKNVFTQPEFKDFAKTNLVLLVVDFPERKKLPRAQERKNEALKDKFKAGEYPAAHILDSNAKQIGVIKWEEGGLPVFMEKLAALQPKSAAK